MKASYFCLSANTRKKIRTGVKFGSILSILLSILFLGTVLYSLYRHQFILHVLIISLFDDLYKNLVTLGVLIFLLSLVCLKLNRNLKKQPTNHSISRTHKICMTFLLVTIPITATCASLMTMVKAKVDEEVGPRLKHGLSLYLDTASWTSAMDRVQTYLQCCGVHGPSDWYTTAWIPMDILTGQNVDYKLVQPSGRVQVPLVPTSCCRVVSAECGHKAWMETKTRSWGDIKPADASLLHMVGCEEAIKATVDKDHFTFKIILLMELVLQIALLIAMRLEYTSTINSVRLGRPMDKAPAWLIGPWLFGEKKRYGYLKEYSDRCLNVETGELQVDQKSPKSKRKCMSKMRCRRSDKETDSEGTNPSDSSGKRRRFKSPCMKKIKSKKCVSKLKDLCSRKSKKNNKKEGESTAVEISDSTEIEGERESPEVVLEQNKKVSIVTDRKTSPERMKTGGDITSVNFEYDNFIKDRISDRKKRTGNLIDFEDTLGQKREQVFEAGAKQLSPFSGQSSLGGRRISKSPTPHTKEDVGLKTSTLHLKKRRSGVLQDFKKRRELFENAGKTEIQPNSSEVANFAVRPQFRPLIDLADIETVKSLSVAGTSNTEMTSVSSVKKGNTRNSQPVFLRNYPPLPPLK